VNTDPPRRVRDADGGDDAAERRDALGQQVPFPKRLGQAEEYARLAVFMAENVYMNAEHVRLDGGIRMAPR
jgi:NAD(P)-dependent dehydrogenase (short-subunit alcohol dehydrogenase family)